MGAKALKHWAGIVLSSLTRRSFPISSLRPSRFAGARAAGSRRSHPSHSTAIACLRRAGNANNRAAQKRRRIAPPSDRLLQHRLDIEIDRYCVLLHRLFSDRQLAAFVAKQLMHFQVARADHLRP